MRANERLIIVGVAMVALAIGFYLLVLGPKRDKASELSSQIDQLHASIATAQQQVTYGEQARAGLPPVLRPHGRPRQGGARRRRIPRRCWCRSIRSQANRRPISGRSP